MARTVDPAQVARRREAIAVAAGRLFGTRGFEGTSVADIARAAGLSTSSVFYYFPDKRSVFRAVFERDVPLSRERVARFADADRAVPAILDLVTELAADAGEPGAAGLLVELLRRAEHDVQLLAVVARTAGIVRDGLAELVARGIADGVIDPALDPRETAQWIQALVDAVFLNAAPGRDDGPALRRTVARYLAPPPRTRGDDGDED